MTRLIGLAVAVALLQQAATFKSNVDAVTVDVSVRDGARVVSNLRADDFTLLDNGVPQQIAAVSYGKLPIDVTLALDVSFSVTGALLDQLRAAVHQLMRDLGPQDRLRLIDFNMRVHRAVDFTGDPAQVSAALGRAAAGGGSSIRDAIAVALVSASEPQRRQLIVVFTDAADSTSFTTPEALLDLAKRTSASVASVVTGGGGRSGPQARQGFELLVTLSKETGGSVIPVTVGPAARAGAPADLTQTFRRVLDDFRSSYVLHFTPSGVAGGGFHSIDVTVKGKRSLTVRARRGYQR